MDTASVALVVSALLNGSLLIGVGKLSLAVRQQRQAEAKEKREERKTADDYVLEGFKLALDAVTAQRDKAFRHIDRLEETVRALELEVQGLRLALQPDPFPRWIVGLDGKFLFVNSEFERQFLEPRSESAAAVIGKGHDHLWPPEFCQALRRLDVIARSRPDGRAKATLEMDEGQVEVFKFPLRVAGVIVAYAGWMIETGAPGLWHGAGHAAEAPEAR